ncbi:hybrid sensor histidine kinase/response regulator [Pandoraea nosoerga]|uniref:histidine kinase n=1 Tax=Pandoraea nosoerga TaxID=2508296 RepID=A0A5E4TJL4_9BURK|nr:hybrid sensor histidine kinase/response regulator [Pandoraea nosoerga]MBN4665382.1 hybrid sensor histidine kinase/response regulator [Pandoraea nosoerga]MBN4674907.1 hybrid sensor histidine kinase/response regulator [Pandoraea nosoerga]MBN4680223.1 hybrid sensor histidine kinase/response regulator [Pandoraea nosoerga]MBN4744544.1 hybrid sensor histidine kinase/response regulator [Pandoraea nosoerga]VVD86319.1 Sensor histidine kinase RcsC [Pandoraea nosoerga]
MARLAALRANLPVSLAGSFLTVWLIVAVLREVFPLRDLLVWGGAQALLTLCRTASLLTYPGPARQRARPAASERERLRDTDIEALRRWDRRTRVGAFAAGLLWGIPYAFWLWHAPAAQQMFMIVGLLTLGTGAIYAYCIHPPVLWAFEVPYYAPSFIALASLGGTIPTTLAAAGVVYLAVTLAFAHRMYRTQIDSLAMRFENDELMARLAVERDTAERSNVAKSRFLAAASHDLRQPVHALSLYVGVLREQQLNARSRQLVEHIGRATAAMGQLFDGLLNISRLDAGVIQPKPRALRLAPLIDQLQLEYAPQAAAKGLILRVHGMRASPERSDAITVYSDPVLLERILRNLIDNAIRHTDRGGILIGWRRRGRSVRIEVWDTGVGIADGDLDKIFLEFHQVGNPERDRSKGLGLGLAIVRRTADLLGHSLTLRSAPGRGSVFALTVPIAEEATARVSAAPAHTASPCVCSGGANAASASLVCVIEDDAENLNGLRLLLDAWGYRTVGGGSGDEIVLAAVAAGVKPALILSDFRLREHETGIDAIDRLHEEFADDSIPAVLISGDTDPQRIVEASARAWPLLHKPVDALLLRRTIERALAGPAGGTSDAAGID